MFGSLSQLKVWMKGILSASNATIGTSMPEQSVPTVNNGLVESRPALVKNAL